MAQYRFIFAADAHTGRYQPGTEALEEILLEAASLNPTPEFVILGGDMVETGMDWEFEILKKVIAKSPIPIYPAIGNHESRWTEDLYQSYTKNFGRPYYSFDHKGIHFIVLDTTIYGQAYGHIERVELDWLQQDVESLAPERPLVVISHHPLAYPNEFTDNWERVFAACTGRNLALHLAGHGHAAVNWSFDNVPCFMAPAVMSKQYLICDVKDDTIKVYKKALGEEPVFWSEVSLTERTLKAFTIPKGPEKYKWRYRTGGAILAAPLVGESEVFVSSVDGALHCVDKQNGRVRWIYETGAMLVGEPMLTTIENEPAVVFTSGIGAIYALRIADRKLLWQHNTERALSSSPAIWQNQVYFGEARAFSALNLKDGQLLWRVPIEGLVNVKPAVDEEGVYFGAWDGYFHAFSHSGTKLWEIKVTENYYFSASTGNPQISGDIIVFTSGLLKEIGGIWAVNKRTGDILWTKQIISNYCTPCIQGEYVYVTEIPGKVYCLELTTGKEVWQINLGQEIFNSQPLYREGRLIVNLLRKSIAIINLETLTYRIIEVSKRYLLAGPKTDQKLIFIGAFDECLYAFDLIK